MKKLRKSYGISRVESKKGRYWLVRLDYVNHKPQIQKKFTDFYYGNKDASFDAAIKFRDENINDHVLRRFRERGLIEGESLLEGGGKEKHKDKSVREKWKQERLQRRIKAISIYGRRKIFVGTGIEGAKKARALGACDVTCWKIKLGQSDSYLISNTMTGYDLSWKYRKNYTSPDMEKQKQNGKNKIVVGTGRDAAIKAQDLGAAQNVCLRIATCKQNFFNSCYTLPHFEVNGFKRDIPKEVVDKVYALASIYDRAFDIAAEVLINYSSRYEIALNEYFLKNLVCKYARILNKNLDERKHFIRKKAPLDINGDIERFGNTGNNMAGKALTSAVGWV